jgi:hypothetical protein
MWSVAQSVHAAAHNGAFDILLFSQDGALMFWGRSFMTEL